MTETTGKAHNTIRNSGAGLPAAEPAAAPVANSETAAAIAMGGSLESPLPLYAVAVGSHIRFLEHQLSASEAHTAGALNPHVDTSQTLREELQLFTELAEALALASSAPEGV